MKASAPLLARLKKQSVVSTEELEAVRNVQLCERGLAGDVPSMIQWLTLFGGPEWRVPACAMPADHYRHDPGRGEG